MEKLFIIFIFFTTISCVSVNGKIEMLDYRVNLLRKDIDKCDRCTDLQLKLFELIELNIDKYKKINNEIQYNMKKLKKDIYNEFININNLQNSLIDKGIIKDEKNNGNISY